MNCNVRAAVLTLVALVVGVPLAAAQTPSTPSAPAVSPTSTRGSGWKTTIYPVYVFAPVLGADVNLPPGPDVPPCESCNTQDVVTSGLSGAYMGALHIENNRIFVDGTLLYAGMSASATSQVAKLEAATTFASIGGGARLVDALFVDAGARRVGLTLKAALRDSREYEWSPSGWTSVIGASYNPQLTPTLKLYARYDYAGIENDTLSSSTLTGRLEWQAMTHLVLTGGYGVLYLNAEGTIRNNKIELNQTLHGPILGIGFTF